jgi:FixJ family two-component response regulator
MAHALYIVDTDASVREGLSRLAESAGFEARPFPSAEAFLRKAYSANGACAVVDLSDAGLLKPAIRARLAVVATLLPVVALSVRDDPQTQDMARELGAQACFRKPVDSAALLDAITWVMRDNKPR